MVTSCPLCIPCKVVQFPGLESISRKWRIKINSDNIEHSGTLKKFNQEFPQKISFFKVP